MIDQNKIQKVAESAKLDKDFVVVDVEVKPTNKFTVYIESLEGITIKDCILVSRHIESNFNRDEEDYELNISSAGIDRPITAPIQFIKNIGRTVEVIKTDGKQIIGVLKAYSEKAITVAYSVKEKMEGSNKRQLVEKEENIELKNIKTVTIVVSFK